MFPILQYVVLEMNRIDQFQKKSLLATLILSSSLFVSICRSFSTTWYY